MGKSIVNKQTVKVILVLLEIAAAIRAGVATWNVTMHVSNGDMAFSAFTVIVVEGVFLASMFMIGSDAIAPIAAVFALLFSAAMQYIEVALMQGELAPSERTVIRAVIAFAPIIILGLAFLRRLVPDEVLTEWVDAAKDKVGIGKNDGPGNTPNTGQPIPAEPKPITLTPEQIAVLAAMADKAPTNGGTYHAEAEPPNFK